MGGTRQFDKIQIVQWNARSLKSDGRSKLPELYNFLEKFVFKKHGLQKDTINSC